MREAVKGLRFKVSGGIEVAAYVICCVMSGLCHSREADLNTLQVNVTSSPGHVNCLSLFEVNSTFSIMRRQQSGQP